MEYGYDAKMELVGTKGVLHVGRSEGAFLKFSSKERGTSSPFINSWMTLFRDAYLAEDISFVESIRNDTQPKVTGVDGRMAVAIVEAGNTSILEKRLVKMS